MDETFHRKLFIKELQNSGHICIWIQGVIEQNVGTDILIVNDGTGKAKIIKCDAAEGTVDRLWICKGAYCCVIGKVIRTKGLPEIVADKLINLSNSTTCRASWDAEVVELQQFFDGKVEPLV